LSEGNEPKGYQLGQEWFFYLLRCRDNSLYAGITNDLESRLREHNRGTGAKYTHGRSPVTLVYSEKCDNISVARKREAQIKRWPKVKKENLIKSLSRAKSKDSLAMGIIVK
jgi:putative endonuclease